MTFRETLLIVIVLIAAGGCAPSAPTPIPTAIPNQLVPLASGYQVGIAQDVVTLGLNRFAIGLFNGNALVKNARLTMTFYDLTGKSGDAEKPIATLPAVYREAPDGLSAIYTVEMTFNNPGSWGLAVTGNTADGQPIDQKVAFDVVVASTDLAVGKKAPSVRSPTVDSVGGDLKKVTSAPSPNPAFYRLSLDQALANGKPTVVQFSTPAFCTSRLCGPVYQVMNSVYPAYADRLNFVHIEVYKDLPNPDLPHPHLADAMTAWGLTTEPWTYVLDKNGVVTWRVEGLFAADELKAAIDRLLKAG